MKQNWPDHFPHWKRVFDLICIAVSLPLWLPLMTLISLWIKCVSRGPVFFLQERIGFRGRTFSCIKFRSMQVNAETVSHEQHLKQLIQSERPMTKLDCCGDSRLIPWGRVFRATGLDELPQIFNIIRGEMSLVGPRPCTPREFELYRPEHRERVNAPPGLTGNWQVNGKNKTTFNEMIQLDIDYARTMSLAGDVRIILKTLPALFAQVSECRSAQKARNEQAPATAVEAVGK
jgi:lipopolysaccharide/colanic/teichoic acid biosynthesis glycosyltransferase